LIIIKSADEISKMREAGRIVAGALEKLSGMAVPGMTTAEMDRAAKDYLKSKGAVPSFLGYRGYPASINTSVNNQVIHGIPGQRKLADGDIISIDIGAYKNGFHGDAARTFPVGKVKAQALELINITRECFLEGIKAAVSGGHVHDISRAVQDHAERGGYSVVREFIGHGVGRKLHEPPDVPNYKPKGRGPLLVKGMTLAVEPMVNAGGYDIKVLEDGWTVVTADGSLSAHYENTIVITGGEPELLTVL
jgi:methionyl aminopeptidase